MPDIVARDRNGNPITHTGVNVLTYDTPDGGKVDFVAGTTVEKTVALDFSAGNMEIVPEEDTFFSKVLIPKPDALIPENVAKGKTIAGVTGNMAGGEVKSKDKTIRFYDPYGEVIYGYTLAEIQELTELPPGPALKGLTFDCWTHTLDELKAITYFADVGPMYKYGTNTATVLILETIMAQTGVTLCFTTAGSAYKFTIYWGDGSNDAVTGGSSSTTKGHVYAEAGEYIVALVCTGTPPSLGTAGNSYNYNVMNNQIPTNATLESYMVGTVNYHLKAILLGKSFLNYKMVDIKNCANNSRLRFVSFYIPDGAFSNIFSAGIKMFANCAALKAIAGKNMLSGSSKYAFFAMGSLRRLRINGAMYEEVICGCDDIEEIEFESGPIKLPNLNVQWSMLMTTETPPTIGAASPVWGTKPIYVPDAAVETYKAADGWSNAADYIFPASKYRATH